MCDSSQYSGAPAEQLPPGVYKATLAEEPTNVSTTSSTGSFGYQAYISPTPEVQQVGYGSTNSIPVNPYGYYATSASSMYAPEEPETSSSYSYSGYTAGPLPSSYYAPTQHVGVDSLAEAYRPEDVTTARSASSASTSETSLTHTDSTVSSTSREESTKSGEKEKTSTSKKIKSLPLPKVGLPQRSSKSKSEQFREYVGEVARLNEEIERLQKMQERLRQEAKKIAVAADDDAVPLEVAKELLEKDLSPKDASDGAAKPAKVSRKSSSRETPAVAEYIPTPLAELERMKREEKKKKKKHETEKMEKTDDPTDERKGKLKPAGSSKRRLLSDDEVSSLFDDDVETKPKKLKEKEDKIKKEKDRPRKSSSSLFEPAPVDSTKVAHSTKSVKKEEDDVEIIEIGSSEDEKATSSTMCPSSSSSKCLKESSPEIPNKRIAREGGQERALKIASTISKRVPSAKEQLQARMSALAMEKAAAPKLENMKPITLEQMYGHRRPNVIGSVGKGEARTARTNSLVSGQSATAPKLRDPTNSKIPYSLRLNFLNKIFSQYLEVCPEVEAVRNSEIEEKAIVDKVRHAQGYKVAAINLIGRIRNAKSPAAHKPKAALSHDAVLAGRHVKDISIRVKNKAAKQSLDSLTEKEFYNLLIERYLMTDEQLTRNGYPRAVAGDNQLVSIQQSHFEKTKAQKSWASKDDLERLCSRCHKEFRLDPKGKVVAAECIYHFKGLQRRGGMRGESFFSCCGADRNTPGCCVAEAHVSDTLNAEALREFTPTPPSLGDDDPRNDKVYAMDCEMVYGVWGPELARVSVVDMHNKLVLDLVVKPHNTVIDYNTRFSGLTANQVEASTIDLFEAQNRLFELVNERSILIGHSLESDLKAMRLRHERVVDTAVVFEHRQGFPFKRALRNLASEYLQKIIQEDDTGHDSQEDSATCMSLMLLKLKESFCSIAFQYSDMASVVGKVQKLGQTLWEHKKKTACAGVLLVFAGNYAATMHMNRKIRTAYALEAKKFGEETISAEERPRRVLVLANTSSNERASYDDFTKNALPLMNLAGLQVDIIKADSESQLEALAAAVDTQEADAMYIVGESSKDVRRMCESAMALIEENRRSVPAFELTVEGADSDVQPIYSVGDVGAGWFRHIEERRRKLWYFGAAKRRWAYFWEMLKRSPTDMEAKLLYEEACTGCRTCRPPVVFEPPAWRWWHILTGPPRQPEKEATKDYSNIVNENCGRLREVELKGTDLIIENNPQEDTGCLRVRMGGTAAGRRGVIADGWRRCSSNRVGTTDNDDFYTTDLLAKAVSLTFVKLPEFIHRLYVSSDHMSENLEGKKIKVKATDRRVEMYLPNALRVDIDSL
ncbi:hypothetical protein Q1695_011246 [Nippostrongylus brasiliensis]|nr:hypothetical protein Q1695_011246 [Nippostrongylus brasiliensis]